MGETAKIYPAIAGVMSEIGAVGKNKRNAQQGFQYRGIDDVMNAINPALINHKVFVVPEVMDVKREDRVTSKGNPIVYSIATVKYTFFAEDGSSIQATVIGEGMDSGDKSMNKAMSIAFKYACFQVFCIPTEEMKDPDAESHDLAPRGTAPQAQGAQKPQSTPRGRNERSRSATNNGKQQTETDPKKVSVNNNHIAVLRKEMQRVGMSEKSFLTWLKKDSLEEMTMDVFEYAMETMKKRPAVQIDHAPQLDDGFSGLTPEEEMELPFA